MRVVIERESLSSGLNAVLDIVPAKTALPVLSNILLETDESGGLRMSATDLDISIVCVVSATVEDAGSTTVPARKFAEIVREMPDEQMVIAADEGKVTVERQDGAAGTYTLMSVPAEDFPELPADIEGPEMRIGGKDGAGSDFLRGMISKTAFAVSRDETRPVLTGVLWQVGDGRMTMVATDGARLVRYSRSFAGDDAVQVDAIVPTRALNHIVKLLGAGCALESVRFGQNHLQFDLSGDGVPAKEGDPEGEEGAAGSIRLFSRLVEGPYVDYEQVIPKSNTKRLRLTVDTFAPAVRRVAILASSQTRQVRMGLSTNQVELTASSQEIGGEARENLAADYTEDKMLIGYNSAYLLDILRRIDSDEVVFELDSAVTAAIIRPADQPEGEDYLCLLMPLRLSE